MSEINRMNETRVSRYYWLSERVCEISMALRSYKIFQDIISKEFVLKKFCNISVCGEFVKVANCVDDLITPYGKELDGLLHWGITWATSLFSLEKDCRYYCIGELYQWLLHYSLEENCHQYLLVVKLAFICMTMWGVYL